MEGTLRVDPSKLMSTADSFGTTGNQVQRLTDGMLSTVDSLKNAWEGDAANAYTRQFNQLRDDMGRIYSMIQEHVKDLNTMAQSYAQAEQTNTESGNALAGDVIN